MSRRRIVLSLWITVVVAALYAYFFEREAVQRLALEFSSGAPRGWAYGAYFFLGCVRGFTLVPVTYLVFAGLLVLPPIPLYFLTLGGIAVSSAAVYDFAEAMELDRFFGALKVDLGKCLLGVTIGEGTICAIYIFLGAHALTWMR